MERGIFSVGLAACLSIAAFGQSKETAPAFEAADVHVSPRVTNQSLGGNYMRTGFYRGGLYEIQQATMVDLVRTAYGVDEDKVLGGPSWLEMDRFEVRAKTPANTTPEALKSMLQGLLAERFSLVVHNDKRELPTYALRVGKKPQLKESDGAGDTGCKPQAQGGGQAGGPMIGINGMVISLGPDLSISFSCHNMTMEAFADALRSMPFVDVGSNPLVNETELKGAWDFNFKFSLGFGPPTPGNSVITIFDAVDKQLGLKLDHVKVPLPVIVVDSVNQKPSANPAAVTEKLPILPTEFEVADIKLSDPNQSAGGGRGGARGMLPGGRVEYRGLTLKNLITLAWNISSDKLVGGPKFIDADRFDLIAKAPATATSAMKDNSQIDPDSFRPMMQALLADRFKLALHTEERPVDAYTLVALKPKLKKADPANRSSCKDGVGPDGKDPRVANPALGRLVTCLNITMAQFAELLPGFAPGYFQTVSRTVLDSTGLDGAWDFTLSFSGAGIVNGGGRGRGGDASEAGQASDPSGGISLPDAIEKQLGLKVEIQKRTAPVLVIDHVEQRPTDN